MTEAELEHHHEVLDRFLDATATGEPVPNEICAAAWQSWVATDEACYQVLPVLSGYRGTA